MPAKVVIKVLEFILLGIDMVWGPLSGSFYPRLLGQTAFESDPKCIYVCEHKLCCSIS